MDDDHDREEHERAMRKLRAETQKQVDGMMNGMIESMAPMLGGSQLLGDEAKAWDEYVVAFVRTARDALGQTLPGNLEEHAVTFADKLLAERRERFNEASFKERMRGMLPSGQGLCNKPLMIDGKDSGHRCTRAAGHAGNEGGNVCY